MGSHALLSASSSKRWLNCPPSARLCAEVEDTTSEYAKEGTDAHTLCEYKVKKMLGIDMQDPTNSLSYYNEEMERCAEEYASYILEIIEEAKQYCKDPLVLIEQRLDFSRYVSDGFGTGDCLIIADKTLYAYFKTRKINFLNDEEQWDGTTSAHVIGKKVGNSNIRK